MGFFLQDQFEALCVQAALKKLGKLRSEVQAVMRIHKTVCRDRKPCSLVEIYQTTRLQIKKNLSSPAQDMYA